MRLIVAEKPIAARRIAGILGKPRPAVKSGVEHYFLDDSVIVPLKGHITSVDFPEQYRSWGQTKLDSLVDAPLHYDVTIPSIARLLKSYAPQCSEVVIASDYDREGESIGKEALQIIQSANPEVAVRRAKFSALTPQEVKQAFGKLVDFDWNLANSADARREIDLIWGAALTRYISLASRRLGQSFLSVGRVQSPALALIVDREKEIAAFRPEQFWVVEILCEKDGQKFRAVYEEERLFDRKKADELSTLTFREAEVKEVVKKKLEIKPPAPFNTTEFLRAASMLGFQPQTAMSIAEKLYMAGLTSYPRTDNTVYPESLDLKEILRKLESNSELGRLAKKILGQKKLEPVRGKRQATDHPPIHPVESADKAKLSKAEWKVYELIARRFLATLATPSEIETVKVLLDYGRENFVARGKTVLSGGWREFYPYSKVEEELLPKLAQGDIASVEKLECHNDETKPKPRYTPATLIKILEDKNLGTKATRAEILQKLIDRGYIQGRQNFTPSQIAFAVIDALEQYSPDITKADMTAKLETEMDLVEQGRKEKDKVVAESRKMLHKVLKELLANQPRVSEKLQVALREDVVLGKCQLCGGNLRMIETPRGTRFVGCSNYSKGCKNSFPLPAKGRIKVLGTACATCGLPMIEVAYFKRRPFQMCINHKCASKAGWKKKGEKK